MANPIYELASLCLSHGQICYDGTVPVSIDVPIYCNVPVQQTNHLLADRQHIPSGRLQAIDVKHTDCNMQKVADVIKSDVYLQITESLLAGFKAEHIYKTILSCFYTVFILNKSKYINSEVLQ